MVSVEDMKTGKVSTDTAEILVSARGLLNDFAWPKIDGFETFVGEKMHSAAWNGKYGNSNARVLVIWLTI